MPHLSRPELAKRIGKPYRGTPPEYKRGIITFLPTVEMAEDWKRLALASNISFSSFVRQHVLRSLAEEGRAVDDYNLRAQYANEIERLRREKRTAENENARLKKENQMLSINYGREPIPRIPRLVEVQRLDKELVQILREGKPIRTKTILQRMKVHSEDSGRVQSVAKQLEALLACELVIYNGRWWRWVR